MSMTDTAAFKADTADKLAAGRDLRTIHDRIVAIIDDLPAIGRDQQNKAQGFAFRGIDQVLNALKPLLAKHGVYYVPDVEERIYEARPTGQGKVMHTFHLHVRWTFYGALGDSISFSTWGEGSDMGDKGTNKALTGAQKYALYNVFSIASDEVAASDTDHDSPADTIEPEVPLRKRAYLAALKVCGDKDGAIEYMGVLKLRAAGGEERELTADETLGIVEQLEAEAKAIES